MDLRKELMVGPGDSLKLDKIDAGYTGHLDSREEAERQLEAHCESLRELQYLMYAENKRSLLIVLQGAMRRGKTGLSAASLR